MIKFGPSGNSIAFSLAGKKSSEQSAKWVKDMGLDCFEYSFGRGVNMTDEKAFSIGNAFKKCGIEISVHAPYYINLANPDDESAEKSFFYIVSSAKKAKLLGAKRVVFHPASQGKAERIDAVKLAKERFNRLTDVIYHEGLDDLIYCPETMGKLAQIGTVEEITRFCKIDSIYTPCIDFGHINARERGSLKTVADYQDRLQYMIDELGYERMKHFHMHFSKIMYSAKGEIKHLTFEDEVYGPEFEPLAVALKALKLEPYIVSDSAGTQAEDAKYMKNVYFGA
jgi:deoxyribonuclease-4